MGKYDFLFFHITFPVFQNYISASLEAEIEDRMADAVRQAETARRIENMLNQKEPEPQLRQPSSNFDDFEQNMMKDFGKVEQTMQSSFDNLQSDMDQMSQQGKGENFQEICWSENVI